MPDDLTDLDDVDLMQLLTALTRWHDFAASRLSKYVVEDKRNEQAVVVVKAEAMVRNWGGGRDERVRITEAQRDSTPEVIAAQQAQLESYAVRKRLEARTQAFEDDAFVVSRELTRRTKMEPMNRRQSRWAGGD